MTGIAIRRPASPTTVSVPRNTAEKTRQQVRTERPFQRDTFVGAQAGMSANLAQTVKPKPLSPAQKKALMNELTNVRDASLSKGKSTEDAYKDAVIALQKRMNKDGANVEVDGKLGGGTWKAMVQLYGKGTAEQLTKHCQMLRTTEGDC